MLLFKCSQIFILNTYKKRQKGRFILLNENDFISISYEEWNKYISMYFETDNNVLCKYIQSYPFTKMCFLK